MDHIPDLSAFQGVMLSADNHYSFAKLKSKGGNEEKIKYILDKVFNFLKEKDYITDNGLVEERCADYEKLALYLVLNADLPELARMTELGALGARVWTLPTLPGALLAELLWGLRMGRFLRRAVAFSEPRLALQLADACVAHLRYMDPRAHLERPALLAGALYRLLCRMPFARALPPAAPAAAAAALRACLARLRAAPADDRVRDDRHRFLARTLTVALRLLEDCLSRFAAVERLEDVEFADVYRATHDPDGPAPEPLSFEVRACPDHTILECLRACNGFLLDDCAALVMEVSVDAFCAWAECGEEAGRTAQRAVGELAHRVRALPALAGHALRDMLAQIERAPPAIEDLVAAAGADTVAERIGAGGPDGAAWLAALLERDDLCRRPELLGVLGSAAALGALDDDRSERLFERLVRRLRDDIDGSDANLLKTLAIEAFRRCGDSAKDRILAEQFRERLHDELETAEFEEAAVDTFNRLVGEGGEGGAGPGTRSPFSCRIRSGR
ncbi:uncharacterized protein [Choristoneura fumiferana]|uniref:uncharacterized protein n=1 Tax=Choristoneura fumiferana TaxID=7141 RepID=UPI003D159431